MVCSQGGAFSTGDIGQQTQDGIVRDVRSLLDHGYVTPELAIQGAVAQAFKADYAAHQHEG